MVTNGIILTISGRDTLKPLGIWFRPFTNNVHYSKYHKRCGFGTEETIPQLVKVEVASSLGTLFLKPIIDCSTFGPSRHMLRVAVLL